MGLVNLGIDVDCFVADDPSNVGLEVREQPRITLITRPPRWDWNRWYSKTPLMQVVTGQSARAVAQGWLTHEIVRRHAATPYDVLYQFSQPELLGLRLYRHRLPPIVLHPGTHAAGELRWLRQESDLARRCETWQRRAVARGIMRSRAFLQGVDFRSVPRIIAMSRHFADHLKRDHGVSERRIRVVPNPIDVVGFGRVEHRESPDGAPIRLLFVSRISVRKGVEMIVALSRRIRDLEGAVLIHVVGDRTLWSDYRSLLSDLDRSISVVIGSKPPDEMRNVYAAADAVLQPSHYEPFGLTVGEALASGLPVVASDEVGATEGVDPRACRSFPHRDMDAFEEAVRTLVAELRSGAGSQLARIARSEARRLFAPEVVAPQIRDALMAVK